jgi:hypothetical protein
MHSAVAAPKASGRMDQILDSESNTLLAHLLAGDINPVMFHQANLHAYDGTHALMTDLLDQVISKYAALRVLPIVSLQMNDMGARMQDRAARDPAGVNATISPGKSITIRTTQAVSVPVTGAVGDNAEVYGAVTISRVTLAAGAEITLPLAGGNTSGGAGIDGGGTPSSGSHVITGPGGGSNGGCACVVVDGRAPAGGSMAVWLGAIGITLAACRRRRH